ncbi:hypothetical protein ABDK10_05485 [Staphylococcus aureus]
MINDNDLLFYDVEVYKYNSFVVFKDINDENMRLFSNDDNFEGLRDYIHDKILVGYNNNYYDNKILKLMVDGKDQLQIKRANDNIITGAFTKYPGVRNKTYDCFQQISVAMPSLKKIEANKGKMILETDVGFDIDRPLTDEEFEMEKNYCAYDVSNTIEVFKERKANYFTIKENLVKMLDNENALKWNTTTISSNILLGNERPTSEWSDIQTRLPEGMLDIVPEQVQEMWTARRPTNKSIMINEFDNEVEFGFGGLHSTHNRLKDVKDVKLLDFASLYPNIIINIEALPKKALKKYKNILEERIEIKHTDKEKSDALKLILNSVYGNLRNKYSSLKNDKAALAVCVYGQCVLYSLAQELAKTCTIIQTNTDGVAFTTDSDDYKRVWKEWEDKYGLTLEEENYTRLIQKDVNNYIGLEPDGTIKVKGGDVGRYGGDSSFGNNSMRIIDIAIVDYLLHGVPVIDTLRNNRHKPHLYQIVLQAGRTYLGTFDSNGTKMNKVNRVFAMKQKTPEPYALFKVKENVDAETKEVTKSYNKFPDSPDNMMIWNDEIYKEDGSSNVPRFEKEVDINFYYQLIMNKLERWETI